MSTHAEAEAQARANYVASQAAADQARYAAAKTEKAIANIRQAASSVRDVRVAVEALIDGESAPLTLPISFGTRQVIAQVPEQSTVVLDALYAIQGHVTAERDRLIDAELAADNALVVLVRNRPPEMPTAVGGSLDVDVDVVQAGP